MKQKKNSRKTSRNPPGLFDCPVCGRQPVDKMMFFFGVYRLRLFAVECRHCGTRLVKNNFFTMMCIILAMSVVVAISMLSAFLETFATSRESESFYLIGATLLFIVLSLKILKKLKVRYLRIAR